MAEEKETKTVPSTEEKAEEKKEEKREEGELEGKKVEEKTKEEKATTKTEGTEKKTEAEKAEEKPKVEEKAQVQKVEEKPKEKKEKEKPAEAPVKVPEKLKKIVKEIEEMKVADLAELVKILEKKFGVSAVPTAAPAPVAAVPGAAPAAAEEKKFFNVSLTAVGEKKIEVIKAVRDITQRGLKESKDLVDKVAEGPQIIKENVKKEEAEEIKKKLTEAGATVELK